ncbi:hypothetical protein O181_037321 [Austropuccinia psidii MF-1]|uniref:CCHC-type domain-containing protein n=1 Tax=Austropuccinia psidii MF-1 TaxID=1389203 RepID=A0A9Q3HAN7_9BASI|nr:hypothetical protein [Austropuccinia psidii MF-1]
MSYSEKEYLKQLPEASTWFKLSGTGEYDYIELIYSIDGLFIDLQIIPDYWITARLNTVFKGHASIRCNHNCTLHEISNTLQDVGKYTPHKSIGFIEKQPFRVYFKYKPRERVAEVGQKKNSCHNCGSKGHYSNKCPKAKNKVYAIENFPEEESPAEDSESDSMGDAIREQSDDDPDPREEFLVEYQEENTLEM